MCKTMHLFSTAVIVAAVMVGRPLPSHAQECPSPPVTADNLVNMSEFGAVPDKGSAIDTTPLFNCALDFARSHNLRAIYFGRGSYTFNTRPQVIDFPITIMGDGKGRTALLRNYNAKNASEGLSTFVAASNSPPAIGANNSSVSDLGIYASLSSSGGSTISLNSNQTTSLGGLLISNLWLSAVQGDKGTLGGNWDVTVNVDGRAKTTDPIGVRDVEFQNCSVFGAATGAMLLEEAAYLGQAECQERLARS